MNRLGTHADTERTVTVFLDLVTVLLLRQNLLHLQSGLSRIQHDIGSEVQNLLQSSRRNVQNQTHAARNSLEIPDVGNRSCKLDMTHALTADAGFCNLNAAAVTDNTFISDFFIFTTVALPVLARSKDSLTEQAVFLRL